MGGEVINKVTDMVTATDASVSKIIILFPVYMFLQVTRFSEFLVTLLTFIRVFHTVCPYVYFQADRFSETLVTLMTSI